MCERNAPAKYLQEAIGKVIYKDLLFTNNIWLRNSEIDYDEENVY